MDILTILKIINFTLVFPLMIYGWVRLKHRRSQIMFSLMLIFFLLSTVLFGTDDDLLFDWLKHLLFFVGQLCFLLFLADVIKRYFQNNQDVPVQSGGVTLSINIGVLGWLMFLTDQGIHHLLTVTFFLLITSYLRAQYVFIKSVSFKNTLNTFMLAAGALTMIHFGEFLVESQKLLPLLDGGPIEIIEFIGFYLGLLFFFFGVRRLGWKD